MNISKRNHNCRVRLSGSLDGFSSYLSRYMEACKKFNLIFLKQLITWPYNYSYYLF